MRNPIHKEGTHLILVFALILAAVNVLCYFLGGRWLFIGTLTVSLLLLFFFTNFFRSPKRLALNAGPYDILAPADGKVVVVEPVFEDALFQDRRIQLSIFMSVADVHANWYPFEGEVTHYSHQDGRFQAAYLPKSSNENERSSIVIKSAATGQEVLVRQIAGAVARRVVTYAYPGKHCRLNEHLGFIKFGSRVDLFLPPESVEVLVEVGEHVIGNRTVVARFKH